MLKHLHLFVCILVLSACTQTKPTPDIQVTLEDPDRIRFHGKGAGAGMMLMSSMGPVGIAVGVAIDEGIGKDIDKIAVEGGFNIQSLIREAGTVTYAGHRVQSIHVDRYGFVTQPGEGDLVAPQLHLSLKTTTDTIDVKYPEGFESSLVVKAELEQVKNDARLIQSLFQKSVRSIFDFVEEQASN